MFEVGKTYHVSHCRKGKFMFTVTELAGEEWVGGTIVEGVANAMMEYNVGFPGDHISMRIKFLTILEEVTLDEK